MAQVLIVDKDELVGRRLTRRLTRLGLATVVLGSREAALDAVDGPTRWSAFIVDLRLRPEHDDESGLDVLEAISVSTRHCFAPRVGISCFTQRRLIRRVNRLGARYLCKPCEVADLRPFALEALSTVVGDVELRQHVVALGLAADLTDKEVEVLAAFVSGLRHEDVAAACEISKNTVATHVRAILAKLEMFGAASEDMRAVVDWVLRRARRARPSAAASPMPTSMSEKTR